ncbi:lysozyme inhibitor LprI family protein [Clostridium sp.]
MKNKGMIAALGLILVLGIVTTAATRRYIQEQAGSERSLTAGPEAGVMYEAEPFAAEAAENSLTEDAPEPSSKKIANAESVEAEDRARMQAEGDVSVQSLGEQKEKRADSRAAAKVAEKQSAGNESDHSVNTEAVVPPVENGIVSPAGGASSGTGASADRTAEDYRNRLGEIENTIQNLENSGSANTTDAMREAVTYEYRLWDAELNQIYQAIMAVLPDEETDTLRGRERRWIRERDTAAKQAAERYKGGTMENVEYTASLANSTRDRAYELLDLYESYLPAE